MTALDPIRRPTGARPSLNGASHHHVLVDEPEPDTHLPLLDVPEDVPDPDPVRIGLSREDVLAAAGAGLAGLAIGLLLTAVIGIVPIGWLLPLSFLWFVAFYTLLVSLTNNGPAVTDRFWTVMLWAGAIVVVGTLAIVILFVALRGWSVYAQMFTATGSLVDRLHFFTRDMGGVGPLDGLDKGGILHAIVGTLVQIGIALAITVPLGLVTAVFLSEVGGRFARFVRTIVEAMTALPSVVAGLFIYAAVIVFITRQSSGLAAALAITVLMLPIMIRSSDVVLRLVPGNLREAGLALGAGQWRVVWHVVLPTVRSGLTTAIILATAHGIGETAPVLLTAGSTQYLNGNPLRGSMVSLPLQALNFIHSAQPEMIARGFATALTLLILVLILFTAARALGGSEPGKLSDRQLHKLTIRSRGTLARLLRPSPYRAAFHAPTPLEDTPR